jgi:hypothetical protein
MSAYKQFTNNDVISVPFTVAKSFAFSGSAITGSNVGIDFYAGLNINHLNYDYVTEPTTGLVATQDKRGVYNSARVLYYPNNIPYYGDLTTGSYNLFNPNYNPNWEQYLLQFTGSISASFGRFYDYISTTLYNPKFFPTATQSLSDSGSITVVSIPTNLYGNYITPRSFKLGFYSGGITGNTYYITDDGEGNLFLTSGSQIDKVGNIFYSHGIAVITTGSTTVDCNKWGEYIASPDWYGGTSGLNYTSIGFSSSLTLYENKYNCTILENEFGFSQNPSLASGSTNTLYSFATGSYFSPYITSIGLYNDDKDLIAIAKLGQPLQCSSTTDTTIMINFDMV